MMVICALFPLYMNDHLAVDDGDDATDLRRQGFCIRDHRDRPVVVEHLAAVVLFARLREADLDFFTNEALGTIRQGLRTEGLDVEVLRFRVVMIREERKRLHPSRDVVHRAHGMQLRVHEVRALLDEVPVTCVLGRPRTEHRGLKALFENEQ